MLRIYNEPLQKDWVELCKRPVFNAENLYTSVKAILDEVKEHGDNALNKYSLQFDNVALYNFTIDSKAIAESEQLIESDLKNAIDIACENIYRFHIAQIEKEEIIETSKGIKCWRKSVAIQNVGLYIPGGTAPLFSTLLMLAIPAKIAGCNNISICTPVDKKGKINIAILYIAKKLGIQNIYTLGGAQAIAALAYGTQTIKKVFKIFGPGNQYVTTAKQLVSLQGVAIDMPAGPSELLVYANEQSNASFVAADLLSQAEHGIDSQVILLATNQKIIDDVNEQLKVQVQSLNRAGIASSSLANSKAIIIENVDAAFDFINEYAPEHLIIATDNAKELCNKVVNAGSVFLGHYSPESVGDYASGTNHTLPTNGFAKQYSGVSVDSFVKKITFQEVSKQGLQNIGNTVEILALEEGLQAHKQAVSIRLKAIKNEF